MSSPATRTLPPAGPTRGTALLWPIVLALLATTIAAYWHVSACGFVNLDDDAYVEFQPMVNQGFRPAALVWAFTSAHSNNWHPLTTLSHMLDCELFGLKSGPMHVVNLGWHALNSVLVFAVWRALSGATWRPAIVAALFALHPLHVESVAWISERKDVLSAFFWLVGMWAYVRYVRKRTTSRYAAVLFALLGALLAKPMAVTFPCTLLLLDFWPLRRWPERKWRKLVVEKLPLFGLVVAHSVLTFLVQHDTGAGAFGQRLSWAARVANALVSYVRYIGKTVFPESLSPLYLHPGYWPAGIVAASAAALVAVTGLALWKWRTHPWLAFGWFWFLGTLVPVIGLVQVGAQALADRYMYVPILGLFTIVVWELAALAVTRRPLKIALAAAAAAVVAWLGVLTARQVPAWTTSIALYERSIAAGEDNAAIRYLLGAAMQAAGRPEADYVAQYRRAVELKPDYVNALTRLAMIELAHQRFDTAQSLVEQTIRHEPDNPSLHFNLGSLWMYLNRPELAEQSYLKALQLDPKSSGAHYELAQLRLKQNRTEEARAHLEARARLDRWNPEALCDYGTLLGNLGRWPEAIACLERALWIRPDFPRAQQSLKAVRQLSTPPASRG